MRVLFVLKLISGAAVGAGCRARLGQLDVHARMHGPQRGLGAGAIDRQVFGLDEYGLHGGGRFCAHGVSWRGMQRLGRGSAGHGGRRPQTLASQCRYLGLRPLTTSKKAFCSFSVTGPRLPWPMRRLSISRMGVTSAAVPVKKASSAMYRSSRVRRRVWIVSPRSAAIACTDSRVMPVSAEAISGSYRTPFLTIKMFSPEPSATKPAVSSRMASS